MFRTITPPTPTSTYYLETIRFTTDKLKEMILLWNFLGKALKTHKDWKNKLIFWVLANMNVYTALFPLISNKLKSKESLLPAKISRPPIKGSIGMLRVQQRATNEMMKAMMRMMRPMIIRAATAWAHAGGTTRNKTLFSHAVSLRSH